MHVDHSDSYSQKPWYSGKSLQEVEKEQHYLWPPPIEYAKGRSCILICGVYSTVKYYHGLSLKYRYMYYHTIAAGAHKSIPV